MVETKESFLSSSEARELRFRQKQFGALLNIDPEELKFLEFCKQCGGHDYQWTDWTGTEIDVVGLDIQNIDEAIDYRSYLAASCCEACDGTSFEGGSFDLTNEQWTNLPFKYK